MIKLYEDAIYTIVHYIEEYLFAPESDWDAFYFKKRSYQRFAAYELIRLILANTQSDLSEIVYNFILRMNLYEKISESAEARFVFETLSETAEAICKII